MDHAGLQRLIMEMSQSQSRKCGEPHIIETDDR